MSQIVVLGGTGYTGSNLVREAAARGHQVTSVSRSLPADPIDGVTYELGNASDVAATVIPGADVVIATLSPRGDNVGRLVEIYGRFAELANQAGARYVQIGGFSSLRPEPGAPRFADADELPEEFRAEALEGEATRASLADSGPEGLDWLFVSPAAEYGSFAPGERTGTYRTGEDVALFADDGTSRISGADFAVAIVDEIESPTRSREQITFAY
jgi:putative NADH-flavin reductase